MGLSGQYQALAACPAGSTFESSIQLDEAVPLTTRDLAIPRHGQGEVAMKLDKPQGALNTPSGGNEISQKVRMTFRSHVWQLSVPAASNMTVGDLMVSYYVSGSAGLSGVFVSVSDPSSMVDVTVIPTRIQRIIQGDKIIFRGFIDVDIDYGRATKSGKYSGAISSSVECL